MMAERVMISSHTPVRCEECEGRVFSGMAIRRGFRDGQREVFGLVHVECADWRDEIELSKERVR